MTASLLFVFVSFITIWSLFNIHLFLRAPRVFLSMMLMENESLQESHREEPEPGLSTYLQAEDDPQLPYEWPVFVQFSFGQSDHNKQRFTFRWGKS